MHRKYCNTTATTITVTIATITLGVTAESAVTPTVIVILSAHHALCPAVIDSDSKQSLQDRPMQGGAGGCMCTPLFGNASLNMYQIH